MMRSTILNLAWKSILARKTTALLTILAVSLSVALFVGVEKSRHSARASFENTISGVDAIVGGRTGPINLLLFSVFRIGDATSPMSWQSYEAIAQRPDVAWSIPISLGDSHRGYRVLGTSLDYFEHYKYGNRQNLALKSGELFNPHKLDVVIGSDIARRLDYGLDKKIILSHGIGDVSFHNHDDHAFTVVGILEPTGTPVDKTIHVSLEAIETMHSTPASPHTSNDNTGSDDQHHAEHEHEHEHEEEHIHVEPDTINAAFIGLKSRAAVLRFNREVNTYPNEALLSIIPGMTLSSLWSIVGSAEKALSAISFFVVIVGLATILITIFTSLKERRREMAILRSLGAGPVDIFTLIIVEAMLLALCGAVLGIVLIHTVLFFVAPLIGAKFGLTLIGMQVGVLEVVTVVLVTLLSAFMSLWPAARATQNTLADGLTIKV